MIRRLLRVATSFAAVLSVLLHAPPAPAALPMPGDPPSGDSAVDQMTGSARLAVPIEVPPGAGGFSPQLAMTYASQGGDSPYGVGFGLSLGPVPLGEVRVSTRFLPNGSSITYELDGERLVPNGTRYHTATAESFKRITREGSGSTAGWLVELPDGTKARYGQDASSRHPSAAPTRWLLSAVTDRNGNTIRIAYADVNAGTPSIISYSYQGHALTAPAIGGLREIRFVYEPRPDLIYDFMGYELRRIDQRLREIRVLTGGNVFRRYRVQYTSNAAGQGRSLVASVQAFGTDCTNLSQMPEPQGCVGMPVQRFAYTTNAIASTPGSQTGPDDASGVPVATFYRETPTGPLIDNGVRPGDVNGDGLPDLVQGFRNENGTVFQRVFLNTGDGWSADTNNTWTTSLQSISFQDKKLQANTSPSSGVVTDAAVLDGGPEKALFADRMPVRVSPGGADYVYPQSWRLEDLDADGYADLIASYLVGIGAPTLVMNSFMPGVQVLEVWMNNRAGGWARSAISDDLSSYRPFGALGLDPDAFITVHDYHPEFGDFDGDERPDLAVLRPFIGFIDPNLFQGFPIDTELTITRSPFSVFTGAARILDVPRLPASQGSAPLRHHVFVVTGFDFLTSQSFRANTANGSAFIDVNRDGVTDYIKTALSIAPTPPNPFGSCVLPDFTANGVWLGKRGGGFCSSLEQCSEANRYLPPVPLNDEASCFGGGLTTTEDTGVRIIDANGDGWLDVIQGRVEVRSSGTMSVRRAFIHNGSTNSESGSVWKEDSRFAPRFDLVKTDLTISPLAATRTTPMDHQFLDIDSDGADDVLYAGGKKMSQSTLPDLIASFDNGRGGVIGFAHETDVRQRTMADPTQFFNLALSAAIFEGVLPAELGFPADPAYSTPRWSKRAVVVAQTLRNMTEVGAPDATTEFTYVAPGFSLQNRTSLGFAGVLTERPDGSFLETFFFQQRGVAGRMVSMAVRDSAMNPLSELRQVFEVRDGSTVPGSTLGVPVPRQVASKSRTHYASDPLPLGQYSQVTSFTYDDSYGYNFASSVTEQRNTGRLVRSATPTPPATFITATTYLPGLPARVEQRDGANRLLSRNDLEYDTLGRVTRMTSLIQARDNPGTSENRVMEIGYDIYGNVRSTSVGSAAGSPLVTEFICYDGDTALGTGMCPNPMGSLNSHALVVGMRDPLGKVTTVVPNATTGLPERTVAFNGDADETVFDRFGRVLERAVDPIRGGVARTVLERRGYNDVYFPGFFRPFIETFVRTGNATEEIRSVQLPDGFGRLDRMAEQTPSGYAGKVITRDPATRTVRETFLKACTDPFCRDLVATGFPATITTRDPLGRVTQVEEWGDAQTRNAITLAQFDRVSRSQPTAFTPPGASMFFEGVLNKNAKGDLTRRILDGNRLVWSEECANTVAATASSLAGVGCSSPDTSYFVYDATGERTRLFDPIAYPSGPFDDVNRYVAFAFDTLGRRLSASDPDAGTTSTVFNVLSQETQTTNARNQATSFTYDLLGRVKTINRPGTEPDSTFTYDDELSAQGTRELARVVNATAGLAPTQEDFEYDPFENLSYRKASFTVSSATTALVTRFESDLLGRRTRIDYPDASTSVSYIYVGDFLSRVCELNTSGACAVDYLSDIEYDGLGRESRAFGPIYAPSPASTPHRFTQYDPLTYRVAHEEVVTVNNFSSFPEARLNHSYSYDPLGNITSIQDLNPKEVTGLAPFSDAAFTYDPRNRLTSRTLAGVTKHYRYDRLGNLTGNLLSTPADPANQTYGDPGRPHAITSAASTTFAYDADGNMSRRGSQHLTYNAANRVVCAGTSAGACDTAAIGYDSGNLRAGQSSAGTTTLFAGDLFEYNATTGQATAHVFALGRAVAFKQITAATLRTDLLPGGIPPHDLFEGIGWLLLGAAGLLVMVVFVRAGGVGGMARRPAYGTALLSLAALIAVPPYAWAGAFPPAPSGSVYRRWVHGDPIGSAVYVSDEEGLRAHKRVFEPFGGIFAETSSEATPRRFGTHLFDQSIGLYYMKARFYDPNVGRFTSLDPVIRDPGTIESVNPYSYVENNPVNNVDPDGRALSPRDALNFNRGNPVPIFPSAGIFTQNPSPRLPGLRNGGTQSSTVVLGPVTITVTTTLPRIGGALGRALDFMPRDFGTDIISERGAALNPGTVLGGEVGSLAGPLGALAGAVLGTIIFAAIVGPAILEQAKKDGEPDPEDLVDKQKKGRPNDRARQNKQVRDAAVAAGLSVAEADILKDEVEELNRVGGENVGFREILDLARQIKAGLIQ